MHLKAMFLLYEQRSITKGNGKIVVIEASSFVITWLVALNHLPEISTLS